MELGCMILNKSQSNKIKLLSLSFLSSVLFVSFVFLLSYGTLINLVGVGLCYRENSDGGE